MKIAFALSTFALLNAGASAVEPSAVDAAVGKNAAPAAENAVLFANLDDEDDGKDGVFVDADRTQEFTDCKNKCIEDRGCSVNEGDNQCKTECKNRCNDDPDYDYEDDEDDDEYDDDTDDTNRSRSGSTGDCKSDCIDDQCSDSEDGNKCKNACKKNCNSYTNYSDFSSSFSYDGDVFASEDVEGSLQSVAYSRRNLRKGQV